MVNILFNGRYTHRNVQNPNSRFLEEVFLREEPIGGKWGEAIIKYESGKREKMMIVLSDETHGFYLKYGTVSEVPWLSLGNKDRLGHNICPDDYEAAEGLFIGRKEAYEAVKYFLKTGERSDLIQWIRPEDLPEGAMC